VNLARRQRRLAALSIFVLIACAPSSGRADEFSDFRVPAHRAYDWSADVSLEGSRQSFARSESSTSSRRGDGTLLTRGFWLSDSDERRTTVSSQAALSGLRSRWRSEGDFIVGPRIETTLDRQLSEYWSLSLSHRRYPWQLPLAFEVDISGSASYGQDWSARTSERVDSVGGSQRRSYSVSNAQEWRHGHSVVAGAALGIGRVRDATVVYDVHVLEERLRRSGALARPLSRRAREQLAALYYVRGPYASVRERPARGLWSEIERVLEEDGALSERGLDAYSVQRAGEPYVTETRKAPPDDGLPRSPVLRQIGIFVGAALTVFHEESLIRSDVDGWDQTAIDDTLGPRYEYSIASRSENHHDAVSAGPRMEVHRPFGPRWQLDAANAALFPLRREDDGMGLTSNAVLSFIVADRWLASGFVSHRREIRKDARTSLLLNDEWDLGVGASLLLYLEDRAQLRLSISDFQGRASTRGSDGSFRRNGGVSLGITYRFLGGVDAPGILAPVRIPPRSMER
jgi:hypothetical protein